MSAGIVIFGQFEEVKMWLLVKLEGKLGVYVCAFVFWCCFVSLSSTKQGTWDRHKAIKMKKRHKATEKCRRLLRRLEAERACLLFEYSSWIADVSALFVDRTVTPWPPYPPAHNHTHNSETKKRNPTKSVSPLYLVILRSCRGDELRDEAGSGPLGCQSPPPPTPSRTAFEATLWFAYLDLIKEGWCQLKMSALNMQSYTYILEKTAYLPLSLCLLISLLLFFPPPCYIRHIRPLCSLPTSLTMLPTVNCMRRWLTLHMQPRPDASLIASGDSLDNLAITLDCIYIWISCIFASSKQFWSTMRVKTRSKWCTGLTSQYWPNNGLILFCLIKFQRREDERRRK